MRDLLMEWMKELTVFSLLFSVCIKLLPGKQYVPYMRLFGGVVLILIFTGPVLKLFQMDGVLADQMEVYLNRIDISGMERKLEEMEEEQKIR